MGAGQAVSAVEGSTALYKTLYKGVLYKKSARSIPPEMGGLLARPSRPMTAADGPVKLVHQDKA